MKKIFYSLVLFISLFVFSNRVSANATCTYTQKELGLNIEMNFSDPEYPTYTISCDGNISKCNSGTSNSNPYITLLKSVTVSGVTFSKSSVRYIDIDDDYFYFDYSHKDGVCPDLELKQYDSTLTIGNSGEISLSNNKVISSDLKCSYNLNFNKIGNMDFILYKYDGEYYYKVKNGNGNKEYSSIFGDTITYTKNSEEVYGIYLNTGTANLFRPLLDTNFCPKSEEIKVEYNEKYKSYYISSTFESSSYDDNANISCIYINESTGMQFSVYYDEYANKPVAKSLTNFIVNKENQKVGASWSGNALKVYDDGNRKLQKTDPCYKNMYYDQVVGTNKIYFSNSDSIDVEVDVKLTLKGLYQDSDDSVILEDLFCTYENNNRYYTFKIYKDANSNSGIYSVWKNFDKIYEKRFKDNIIEAISGVSVNYIDNFSIRDFYEENTDSFYCPPTIYVGEQVVTTNNWIAGEWVSNTTIKTHFGYNKEYENPDFYWNQIGVSSMKPYNLVNYSSYIDSIVAKDQGNVCVFSRDGSDNWLISLQENEYDDGSRIYTLWKKEGKKKLNNVVIDIPTGIIYSDCSELPEIYTDCLKNTECKVSQYKFSGSERLLSNEIINSKDYSDYIESINGLTGDAYKSKLCSLSGKLNLYLDRTILNSLPTLSIYNSDNVLEGIYAINKLKCDSWGFSDNYDCNTTECMDNLSYAITQDVKEIKNYCNDTFSSYLNDEDLYEGRKDECISFNTFYDSLVKQGIISDLTAGCDFISNELAEKLVWILDLLKIAGPILALGLGTLDFIKVIASGDSDKEMKNAFKRFSIRILAAILLFIIPVILAFLMDAFIGDQEGYDTDNPFCIDVYGGK